MSRTKAIAAALCAFYAFASMLAGWLVYSYAYNETLDRLEENGLIRVQQASDRLMGQLSGYSYLINLLARHPEIIRSVVTGADRGRTGDILVDAVLTYGADRITVTDRDGRVVTSSAPDTEPGFVQQTVGSSLLRAALNGRLGSEAALDGDRRMIG